MLRLNLTRAPRWVDLGHGVRVQCAPVTGTVLNEARRALAGIDGIPTIETDADGRPIALSRADQDALSEAMTRQVAQAVITDWEGVGDDDGNPIAPSPDGIAALMDLLPLLQAFQVRVMAPAMMVGTEKNGSAPLPSGISTGARTTAKGAKRAARTAPRH